MLLTGARNATQLRACLQRTPLALPCRQQAPTAWLVDVLLPARHARLQASHT